MWSFNLSLKVKGILAFASIIGLTLSMGLAIYWSTAQVNRQFEQLTQTSIPLALTSQSLLRESERAISALRGQIILGSDPEQRDKFIQIQQDAWSEVNQLQKTLSQEARRLGYANADVTALQTALTSIQQSTVKVANVANTLDNQPALKLLVEQAIPAANQMLASLETLIDQEAALQGDEDRGELLKLLSDSSTALAVSIGNLRAYLLTNDAEQERSFNQYWLKNSDAMDIIFDEYEDYFSDDQLDSWENYLSQREKFAPVTIKIFQAQQQPDANRANYLLANDVAPLLAQLNQQLERLDKFVLTQMQQAQSKGTQANSTTHVLVTVVTLLVTVIGLFIMSYTVAYINRNLALLTGRAKQISDGDLTTSNAGIDADSKDEFQQLQGNFNQISGSLATTLHLITCRYRQVEHSSHQVAAIADEISAVAEHEKSNYAQVMQAIERFTALLNGSSKIVSDTVSNLKEAQSQAQMGISAVNSNIQEMRTTRTVVEQAVAQVEELQQASEKIADVTEAINTVADQTNLISLNAAIEAARAGEHGRGFAVVAEEVRALARRTSDSTHEIDTMISHLRRIVGGFAESMQNIIAQVGVSEERSQESGTTIENMVSAVEAVAEGNHEVADKMDSQLAQMDDLQSKLSALFNSLRENAEKALLVTHISSDLNTSSEAVSKSLSFFKFNTCNNAMGSQANEKRQHPRLTANIRLQVQLNGSHVETVSRDFSLGGLAFSLSREALSFNHENGKLHFERRVTELQGRTAKLRLFLPTNNYQEYQQQAPMLLQGEVLRVDEQSDYVIFGVRFTTLDPTQQQTLENLFNFFG